MFPSGCPCVYAPCCTESPLEHVWAPTCSVQGKSHIPSPHQTLLSSALGTNGAHFWLRFHNTGASPVSICTGTPNPEGHEPLSLTAHSTLAGDLHTSAPRNHSTPRDCSDESTRDTGRETNVPVLWIPLDSFQRNGFSSSLLKPHCSLL